MVQFVITLLSWSRIVLSSSCMTSNKNPHESGIRLCPHEPASPKRGVVSTELTNFRALNISYYMQCYFRRETFAKLNPIAFSSLFYFKNK